MSSNLTGATILKVSDMSSFSVNGPTTILGGLPVWAEFTYFRGDWGFTDDDFQLDGLYWLNKDGTKGKPLPKHMYDRAENHDTYFCDCFQQLEDNLMEPDHVENVDYLSADTAE